MRRRLEQRVKKQTSSKGDSLSVTRTRLELIRREAIGDCRSRGSDRSNRAKFSRAFSLGPKGNEGGGISADPEIAREKYRCRLAPRRVSARFRP